MALTIGVDVGGTKVAAGVVDDNGELLAEVRRDTPATGSGAVVDTIVAVIEELRLRYAVTAVGVAAPGFVDETRSVVRIAPNIPGWRDLPLRVEIEKATGLHAVVENDANAAAWAEVRHGAGRGQSDVICVTVGTGVGGGIVSGGELHRGRFGNAAEVGHMKVMAEGRPCGCGQRGCWEQYASGSALVREVRARAAAARFDAHLLLSLGDGTPEGVSGRHVTEAARGGDPVAIASFEEVGRWLGLGMADLAAVLDPGCFVVGGGVSEAGELLLSPARRAYEENLSGQGFRPVAEIRAARFGNDAGMIGAADLARR
ncbi:MAG: ROK family glucokinase [Actinomycetota bacterium]|nr:ROK family glucokinase [Actinomycetota bacterium]